MSGKGKDLAFQMSPRFGGSRAEDASGLQLQVKINVCVKEVGPFLVAVRGCGRLVPPGTSGLVGADAFLGKRSLYGEPELKARFKSSSLRMCLSSIEGMSWQQLIQLCSLWKGLWESPRPSLFILWNQIATYTEISFGDLEGVTAQNLPYPDAAFAVQEKNFESVDPFSSAYNKGNTFPKLEMASALFRPPTVEHQVVTSVAKGMPDISETVSPVALLLIKVEFDDLRGLFQP
ncbi:hypothetical protein BTVI_65355 [Pitangus sulphuratus]|nr:hypothetical protein BTVI_65355 [Pitangus sulphuratus]